MQILNGRRHRVESIAFSHCGRWLAAGVRGVHIWDTTNPTAKPKHLESQGVRHFYDLAFLPDGRLYFSDSYRNCNLIDPVEFKEQTLGERVGRFVPTLDGTRFVRFGQLGLSDWKIDAKQQLKVESQPIVQKATIGAAAFSFDGTLLATTEIEHHVENQLVIRAADTLKKISSANATLIAEQLVFSPDGSKVILRSAGSLACFDTNKMDAKPQKTVNPSRKFFHSMVMHPEGKLLTVDTEALVKVWDINTLTVIHTVQWNIGGLYSVAVSNDGTRAATGGSKGKVLVWDWD